MYYKFRKNPLRCHRCGMKFHTKVEKENHDKGFCIGSKYDDPEYLEYIKLREKFNPQSKRIASKKTLQQSLNLEALIKRSKELDKEMNEMEEPEERPMSEVEKLVELWKENKKINGVEDSDVERRVQVLFDMLEQITERKTTYMNDIEMFKKHLDKTFALTTKDVVRRKALEDILIQRDKLFERENKFLKSIQDLKDLYLRIKDYEFEGRSAEEYMYRDFKNQIQHCEFEDENIILRRNQILNNFETVTQQGFIKYFGQRGKNLIYDNDLLKKIIKESAIKANDLKIEIRDLPRNLIDEKDTNNILKQKARFNRAAVPNEPLALKSRKNVQNVQDISYILSSVRKNIEMYGLKNGLKKADSAFVPVRVIEDQK